LFFRKKKGKLDQLPFCVKGYITKFMKESSFTIGITISPNMEYLISAGCICIVSGVCFLLSRYIGAEVVAFILLLVLSLIAMFFDILPVLLAATLSALIWDYFFLLPRFNLRVGNTEDKIMLSMYFLIALVNAVLTNKIRNTEKSVRQREERVETVRLYNTLLNSLSHEFRTPLATIIAATDNLMTRPSQISEDTKESLVGEISTASMRLNRQVENLLNMSRLESGVLEIKKNWCNVNELVESVFLRLQDPAKNHVLENKIPENFPLFNIDYGLMEQVLYNIIYNATQYTPEKSRVSVSVMSDKSYLMMSVEDDGPGFPEQEISLVFNKFYRLNRTTTGGTGLGLSIVRGFVEAHNGRIELENRKEGGSRFLIKIPTEQLYTPIDERNEL
jgi:two-component system, OmpR family, sensor histidine kinase KdpD